MSLKFHYITLFPQLIENYLSAGLLKRASDSGLMTFQVWNLRDEATGSYKSVDDQVYGGSDGLLLEFGPLKRTLDKITTYPKKDKSRPRVIYLSPQGRVLDQSKVVELSQLSEIVLISGRYAGVDQRFIYEFVDEEISIGDYVLSGGELPSLVLTEAVSRQIDGVLGKKISVEKDSFYNGLLEMPQFTKPSQIQLQDKELLVPEVLLSGNHQQISVWNQFMSLLVTLKKRPDLFDQYIKDHSMNWLALVDFYKKISQPEREMMGIDGLENDLQNRIK